MHPRAPELKALAEKWAVVPPAERVTSQPFLIDFCNALGVARPDPGRGDYSFEYPVQTTNRKTGVTTSNWIDLYRKDHFILESKHVAGDRTAERVLGAAYGQAKGYAADIPHVPPPFLLVLNVGRTLLVWDRWGGNYGGVNAARRIDLTRLWERPEEIEFLRAVWENPASLDPSVRGRQVTRDVAEKLAKLSASLEARGFEPERVAKFLIRCVFTMFAEDVELLQGKPFQEIIGDNRNDPAEFRLAMEDLWQKMDRGERFGAKKLLRFNGHFFHEAEALELTPADLSVLADAVLADWKQVEPTIFGTLLTRALDPAERHRLGAEYTPREYVERVVRQTVDVPIRERWAPVQAEVLQLTGTGRKKDRDAALGRLREFHGWMRGLRFLDPACGSGNFLYVTLNMVKRVELEVLRAIEEITGHPELAIDEVGPWQFHGIEVKPWAREIAELTLWIGFHQFWMEHHKGVNPPEPVLKDTGTLEQRDAVLAYDEIVEVPEKSRPDPTPRIVHPVTGKLVPDPEARLVYKMYKNPRPAPWPQADFIVGNPPYLGQARMREEFGDGYAEALRATYPQVPQSADYVMYWWYRAALAIASGDTVRAGLITTQSITQSQNRRVIAEAA
ncbi:MAG TPA: DNA methyltransferase, partial [Longimicrobium sp.]|nr:DNA methyltransferase [Longimicrobium sp.]